MTVVAFPASGLTEADYQALQAEGYRRLEKGLPGVVTRGYGEDGQLWARLAQRPGGRPLFYFYKESGVYYVVDFGHDGTARLVDAQRSIARVLENLPEQRNATAAKA